MGLSVKKRFARNSQRVRKKLKHVSPELYRLSVYKSGKHIYVQIIDDLQGKTLAAASSLKFEKGSDIEAATKVGEMIAEKALSNLPKEKLNVKFDRGGYRYHGRIKALADAAREKGLKF